MIYARTDRVCVRFIPHMYDDGSGWLGIESTDGKVLPLAAESFFRLDLKRPMTFQDAVIIAAFLNERVEAFGQSQLLPPTNTLPA